MSVPNWMPSLPSANPGEFELADLLRFAGVLGAKTTTRTYTVKAADTLTKIAQKELGDGDRWQEIFLLTGRSSAIPTGSSSARSSSCRSTPSWCGAGCRPRIYVVKRGDTLSGIAAAELGDAGRWPEIFAINKAVLTNPDLIVPGTVLVLP